MNLCNGTFPWPFLSQKTFYLKRKCIHGQPEKGLRCVGVLQSDDSLISAFFSFCGYPFCALVAPTVYEPLLNVNCESIVVGLLLSTG
jgi:hypothetical protein